MRSLLLLSVTAVVATTLGLTPKASNSPGSLLIESFDGSNGDICSGHAADVDDPERKLDDGLSGMPFLLATEEFSDLVGVKVYCVSSSSCEVISQCCKGSGFKVMGTSSAIICDPDCSKETLAPASQSQFV